MSTNEAVTAVQQRAQDRFDALPPKERDDFDRETFVHAYALGAIELLDFQRSQPQRASLTAAQERAFWFESWGPLTRVQFRAFLHRLGITEAEPWETLPPRTNQTESPPS